LSHGAHLSVEGEIKEAKIKKYVFLTTFGNFWSQVRGYAGACQGLRGNTRGQGRLLLAMGPLVSIISCVLWCSNCKFSTNKDNPNQAHDKVILNYKEDCPFVIRASKFNHKISLFQRQKTSNF
jgi:hypothetical protein